VIRYVIVAQLTAEVHTPSVYGLWKTREAAEEQDGPLGAADRTLTRRR
jgi:hypothetical protein